MRSPVRGSVAAWSLCGVMLVSGMPGFMGQACAQSLALAQNAKSAILIDAMTGTVLFAKNEHARLPIASVTKVATLLLVMEALDRGQVRLTDPIRSSERAASMGGSQIFLQAGEQMTLRDMLKGIAISSANDATVAVAEHLAGSEGAFVQQMNERVHALQLRDSNFANSNGLPAPNHYSSAYDIAALSRELLRHDTVLQFTSVYSDYLRKHSQKPFWLVNTNKLVRYYRGMDGIKTGFTSQARFCLAASAVRDHLRLIAVVLGEPTAPMRNREVTELMNYGYSHYAAKVVYKKGQVAALAPVIRGQLQAVGVAPASDVALTVGKVDGKSIGEPVIRRNYLIAPVKKGQAAGAIALVRDGKTLASVPLYAIAAVDKVSWWEMLGRAMRSMLLFGSTK